MPLTIPTLDTRRYEDLLDEALARIPVHNPEWTNFNRSDPGVTLIEVFAFLTESLLYRANQIPERNRRKFLSLLGVPLQPASSARGLVTFSNDRGPLQAVTLNQGIEVRSGEIPFRTERGLDVLPIEAPVRRRSSRSTTVSCTPRSAGSRPPPTSGCTRRPPFRCRVTRRPRTRSRPSTSQSGSQCCCVRLIGRPTTP
jgi:predicted phage baseplate assembly protein